MKMIEDCRTAFVRTRGEDEALLGGVALHHLFEAGLVDGHPPAPEQANLGGILVDTDDVVAVFGEACSGDQPDVAGADNGNLHARGLLGHSANPRVEGKHENRTTTQLDGINILTHKDLASHRRALAPMGAPC